MEARRRQASASTSTSLSHEERSLAHGKGSGSVTPKRDDEDEGAPRRTRGRNPLPPTNGPLFPPLPPKQSKNSPKYSPKAPSRSPAGRTPRLASSSALSSAIDDDEPASNVESDALRRDGRRASPTKPNVPPSASSLTPPPGDGDEMDVDTNGNTASEPPLATTTTADDAGDDWDAYRRSRGVRSFSGAKPAAPVKIEPVDADAVQPPVVEPSNDDGAAVVDEAISDAPADPDTVVDVEEPSADGEASAEAEAAEEGAPAASAETTEQAQARARRRRGEDQLLLDDHLLPKELRVHAAIPPRREKAPSAKRSEPVEPPPEPKQEEAAPEEDAADDAADEEEDDEDDDSKEEITRCVCKNEEDADVMMIQCDKCNVWQHGGCVGIWGDDEAPDEYFCEECRPDLHTALRKWIRRSGRNAPFVAPTPSELQALHNSNDKNPPSQSKRWTDPDLMDPLPPKPAPRSHHRKETDSDAGRRSARGRDPPAPNGRDKSAISSKDGARDRRRPSNRRVSTDVSSMSPPPSGRGGVGPEPRKRSTMNSRDAAYEEALKASLEASRRELSGDPEKEESADDRKRRRPEDDDGEEAKKGKKKKEDEDESSEATAPTAPSKPKHPNQYTYRPKSGGIAQSPARRGTGTPQPTLPPPSHEHGTRRAGAIASSLASANYATSSISNLNWYLPDHLSAWSDLLPASTPTPLVVPTPRSLQFLPRSHFLNQRYGPFVEDRDEAGKLILPDDRALRETDSDAVNHREPPTRVRYPVKRITVSEMRKRVRNVLEYVGRVQIEETKRGDRAKQIGIPETLAPRPRLPPLSEERYGKGKGKYAPIPEPVEDADGDVSMTDAEPVARSPTPPPPTAAQLLEELTADLIAFQEAFHTGDFESLSFVTPARQPSADVPAAAASASSSAGSVAPSAAAEPEQAAEANGDAEIEAEAEAPADAGSMDGEEVPRELPQEDTPQAAAVDGDAEMADAEEPLPAAPAAEDKLLPPPPLAEEGQLLEEPSGETAIVSATEIVA
ncbi:Histone deacetylase complex subunit [Vanrija albida]|uniref:Histone deacetylase complex subunit n=1 Tax=Vanrija albida TaxID=181172 RepID=A0ABR3QEC8_9TREE